MEPEDMDVVPNFPPRVVGIYWTAGELPVVEAPGFADWEVAALLWEALNQYTPVSEDEDAET